MPPRVYRRVRRPPRIRVRHPEYLGTPDAIEMDWRSVIDLDGQFHGMRAAAWGMTWCMPDRQWLS